MGLGWNVTRGILGASNAAGRHLSNSAATHAAVRQANRGSGAARRGVIGPWDQVPAGAENFLDFTGLATPRDLRLQEWSFPLGRYVLPKAGKLSGTFQTQREFGISEKTANRHTAVYAPTQAGKTTSVIAPWIYAGLRQGYFVVTLDLKGNGDLLDKVNQFSAAAGPLPGIPIANLDYTDPTRSATWNWIRALDGDDAAIEAAAAAIIGEDRDVDPNREFRLRDTKWLRALLEFASTSDQTWTIATLLRLLDDHTRFARYITTGAPERARSRLSDLIYLSSDEYYEKIQFLTTYLETLNTDGFTKVTSRRGIDLAEAADEPGLLVVTAPLADGKLSEAISGLFLSQLLQAQLRKFNRSSRPVLLVLDEAPRLKDRLDLPRLMATSASSGMSVLLALQEVTDLEEKQRETILSNCGTHILLAGAGEATTSYFGKRLGTRNAVRQTQTMTHSRRDGATFQAGVQNAEVPVLGRTEMANPPGGDYFALVHCRELSAKPILTDLGRRDLATP